MRRSDSPVPPHVLVVVPGMMGSKLRSRHTGRLVWLDFDSFPLNPFARDDWFDPFSSTAWPDDDTQATLLADGRRFNQELGTALSVETLCFFGRKRPTFSHGVAEMDAGDLWDHIAWETLPLGDGTVPESRAIHPAAQQKLPFLTSHGSIYAHPAVLEILRWELRDRFSAAAGAPRPGSRNALAVTIDREQYLPGATIQLTAELEEAISEVAQERLAAGQAAAALTHEALDEVRDGRIHVQLAWQSGLPGNPPLPAAPEVVPGVLAPDPPPASTPASCRRLTPKATAGCSPRSGSTAFLSPTATCSSSTTATRAGASTR